MIFLSSIFYYLRSFESALDDVGCVVAGPAAAVSSCRLATTTTVAARAIAP
jgi:hypothetical protein